MKRSLSTGLCFLLLLLLGCEHKEPLPLEDFYSFADVNRVRLQTDRTDYYIGIDSLLIPTIKALDSTGQIKILPDSAFSYFLNGQRVASKRFVFTSPGSQTITAQFGKITSNALVINAIDPATIIQSLQLTLNKSSGIPFLTADGVSQVRFQAVIVGKDGKEIPIKLKVQLRANGQPLPDAGIFQTSVAGTYQITATSYGKTSNAIFIQARPAETYPVVKIPVIFHFINTSTYNGSYKDLLKKTSDYFRNLAPRFTKSDDPAAVDTYIEFEPATNDPSGKPLDIAGEHIVSTGPQDYSSTDMISAAFENFYWNPNTYLNVYLFDCTTCASEGAAGFAHYPSMLGDNGWNRNTSPKFAYATYVDNKPTYLSPSLLAHEFGHMLSLAHIFNGNGNDDSAEPCAKDVDECDDTPLYARRLQPAGLENYERISCFGQHFLSTNLMDYGGASGSFTYNQRQRMRNVIEDGLWLPTPKNKVSGGRLAASKTDRSAYVPVKPTIVICPVR